MKEQYWQIIGSTVQGASHIRSKMPNQDAISWHQETGKDSLPIIMAVSDGHGSAKYFRSDRGAQFAVEVAKAVLQDFLVDHEKSSNLSLIKNSAEEWLPKTLVRSWREIIREDIKKNPISHKSTEETKKNRSGEPISADTDWTIAYGATLLIAVITEEYLLFLQIGDGDILVVSEESEVYRPIAEDSQLIGNETTSLCSKDAWRDFRVTFKPLPSEPPALLLLSTDGYANSFRSDEGFRQVAVDIYQMIGTEGAEYVKNNLEEWLTDATHSGSGDDISVGIIYRTNAFNEKISELALIDQEAESGILTRELSGLAENFQIAEVKPGEIGQIPDDSAIESGAETKQTSKQSLDQTTIENSNITGDKKL